MNRFIAQENIRRFERLLVEATEEPRRTMLRELLEVEQQKFAALDGGRRP